MEKQSGLDIDDILAGKREQVLELARQHGVWRVRVFGSAMRGEATAHSDLDLLVDGLENAAWGGGRLLVELEALLGRRVDLLSPGDLHPLLREQIMREAIAL